MTGRSGWGVVAAYCADPGLDPGFAQDLMDAVDARGLELPWGSSYFDATPPEGEHVVTLVPATLQQLHPSPSGTGFGLASLDPEARRAAIGLVRRARDAVEGLTAACGAVGAVQLPSAPRSDLARLDEHRAALTESLVEIGQWDWCGARIVVEHWDSAAGTAPH